MKKRTEVDRRGRTEQNDGIVNRRERTGQNDGNVGRQKRKEQVDGIVIDKRKTDDRVVYKRKKIELTDDIEGIYLNVYYFEK